MDLQELNHSNEGNIYLPGKKECVVLYKIKRANKPFLLVVLV